MMTWTFFVLSQKNHQRTGTPNDHIRKEMSLSKTSSMSKIANCSSSLFIAGSYLNTKTLRPLPTREHEHCNYNSPLSLFTFLGPIFRIARREDECAFGSGSAVARVGVRAGVHFHTYWHRVARLSGKQWHNQWHIIVISTLALSSTELHTNTLPKQLIIKVSIRNIWDVFND